MWKALCLELGPHGAFKQAYAVFQKKRHSFRHCHFLGKMFSVRVKRKKKKKRHGCQGTSNEKQGTWMPKFSLKHWCSTLISVWLFCNIQWHHRSVLLETCVKGIDMWELLEIGWNYSLWTWVYSSSDPSSQFLKGCPINFQSTLK